MQRPLSLGLLVVSFMLTSSIQAAQIVGTLRAPLKVGTSGSHTLVRSARSPLKEVVVMKVKLSPQEIKNLQTYDPYSLGNPTLMPLHSLTSLPSRVNLGMNNVPVLDQGLHGTCATFANTAAINAVLKKGDYISQLCNLELGSYLVAAKYKDYEYEDVYSGWDGSYGPVVLNQITHFGIVSKSRQKSQGCAGFNYYPTENSYIEDDKNFQGTPMTVIEFQQKSENIKDAFKWEEIKLPELFSNKLKDKIARNQALIEIKRFLAEEKNGRITFGMVWPKGHCNALSLCGQRSQRYDDSQQPNAWVLMPEIVKDVPSIDDKGKVVNEDTFIGHEMVIVGYDDNGIIKDESGKLHKGFLIIRNSWGRDAGDQGTYYIGYGFFKNYVSEIQKISPIVH